MKLDGVEKLVYNLHNEERYVIHVNKLQHWLKLSKAHLIIAFKNTRTHARAHTLVYFYIHNKVLPISNTYNMILIIILHLLIFSIRK